MARKRRAIIKYKDGGEYKDATVSEIGYLDELKTKNKTSIVEAINSIQIDTELFPRDITDSINRIESKVISLEQGDLNDTQKQNISKDISVAICDLRADLSGVISNECERLGFVIDTNKSVTENEFSGIESRYNNKTNDIINSVKSEKDRVDCINNDLSLISKRLNTSDTNYLDISSKIDTINGELTNKIESSKFDLMQSKVEENRTRINQNKTQISLKADKNSLDYANDRIAKAESELILNQQQISLKVSSDEMQNAIMDLNVSKLNLLRGTRRWDDWEVNYPTLGYSLLETYRSCRMFCIENSTVVLSKMVGGLEVGKTYTLSAYCKATNEINGINPLVSINTEEFVLDDILEDTHLINGWTRRYLSFVAEDTTEKISLKYKGLVGDIKGYFVALKLESGTTVTSWQPNVNDSYNLISHNESDIKQTSDQLSTLVLTTEKIGNDIESTNTQINQFNDKLSLQSSKVSEVENKISEAKSSIELMSNEISQKVTRTNVNEIIADITLDTKNRIINSDFSRGFNNWNEVSDYFKLDTSGSTTYASVNRRGTTGELIASMASDKFPVKNKEKLTFSFDMIIDDLSKYDVRMPITIELFDKLDVRLISKTFDISELKGNLFPKVIRRLYGSYVVDNSGAYKARIKLNLHKNGYIRFSKIMLQKGDIKTEEYQIAPEDSELTRVKMATEISQKADRIELSAIKTDIDAIGQKVTNTNNELVLSNESISSISKMVEKNATEIKDHESKIEQNSEKISSKVTSNEVEDIIDGKKFATKTELTQTASTIVSQISELDKNDAENSNKISQVKQSINDISQTIMNKADISNIKQLANEISSKVAKGDLISEINQTSGEVKINADKVSLNGVLTINDFESEKDLIYKKMENLDGINQLKESIQNLVADFSGMTQSTSDTSKAVTSLEDRSAGMIATLNDRVAEFDFVKTYFKLGEEGFLIGREDSPVQMLLTEGKLSFLSNGVEVAYFSNQNFYILEGAVVKSLQIGNHKIGKGDGSHTTIKLI